jgi:putative acetyltransferase
LNISLESPAQPDVIRLIDELDAYQKPMYPAESHHGIDIDALLQPNVIFAVARNDTGEAVGCGAIVIGPERRGQRCSSALVSAAAVGKALLEFLEARSKANALHALHARNRHLSTRSAWLV